MTVSCSETGGAQQIRLAELLSALSHALDMVEGQPVGHCVRCCWIVYVGGESLEPGKEMRTLESLHRATIE